MANNSRNLARRCAVQALYQWRITAQSPADIGDNFIPDENLKGRHLEYFHHLIARIPQCIAEIDARIAAHLDRDAEQVDVLEQAILRLGVYELMYAPDIPMKVVLNEAVELARLFCAEHGYKYVNAVLDKAALEVRGADDTPAVRSD